MKLIIAGSRALFPSVCDIEAAISEKAGWPFPDEIVSGTARGVDQAGEAFAAYAHIPVKRFPADWDTFGKSAGFIRNGEMADYATHCLLFWDGTSRGTKHMKDIAERKNLPTYVEVI